MTDPQNISGFHQEVIRRLEGVRTREMRLSLLYGSLAAALVSICVVLAAIILEQVVRFGTGGRAALLSAVAVCAAGSFAWFAGRPLLLLAGIVKPEAVASVARKVGAAFPHVRDRLLDALEMVEGRDRLAVIYSPGLIDAAFRDVYGDIRTLDFSAVVSDSRVRRMGRIVGFACGLAVLTFVVSPSGFLGSMDRILRYNMSFAATQPLLFRIEPGNVEAVRGENVPVTVRVEGRTVSSLSLLERQQGRLDFDRVPCTPGPDGAFHASLNAVRVSTEYFAGVDDEKSDTYTISVLDRPLIRSLQLRVAPPPYTGIPPKTLDDNVGDVSGYPGTKVEWRLKASAPLSAASAVFGDSGEAVLACSAEDASGSMTLRKNGTYHILLTDQHGLHNLTPVEYSINVVPDERPSVEILSPARNIDLTEDMRLNLLVRMKDDFGFSRVRLAYRLVQSRFEKPAEEFSFVPVPAGNARQASVELPFLWNLAPLHLVPEDAVAYYVEAFDNDVVSGPKSGVSQTFIVRLPSLEEVFSDVAENHDRSMESIRNVAGEAQQVKKEIEELQRELKKNTQKTDWQQQKKAEDLAQRYESMKKTLEDVSRKMDEMMKKMDENKLLSPETLDKYKEMQKLMDQLKSPELQEALKKLQEAMKQLSPEQIRQAMEQVKLSENQFRQSLERTIELLKRIHIEQKIDELIKRAGEMKNEQEALKEQAGRNEGDKEKRDRMAAEQEELKKQAESLEKEAADLKDKMEEFSKEMPVGKMQAAQEGLKKKDLPKKMQQSSRAMQGGEMRAAQEMQEQSEQGLEEFEQQMKDVQKELRDQQMQQVANQMRKQLQNLLELSKRQEGLKEETRSLEPNAQRFRESAQQQNEVQNDLGNVADAMNEMAKKTFAVSPEMGREIGNALKQMGEAMKNMESRNPGGTAQKQGEAMGSLNRAAMQMQSALNGMMNGSQSGMGMSALLGRLGQMSGMQGGINEGTKGTMGQGEGQGLSASQAAEYGRLAGQQGAVQKSLEELSAEAKNTGEFSKLLGDLDKVAQEMQEVQTDLAQGNVNPETIQKEERILSRLLDSQRSLRERDYEQRRKAETGKAVDRLSPADIDLTTQEGRNRLRQEFLRVVEGKYSRDYEELIRKYFEQLEKEEIRQ